MSAELAARMLVVYESRLPLDGRPANLAERLEAMRLAIEDLSVTSSAAGKCITVQLQPGQAIPIVGGASGGIDRAGFTSGGGGLGNGRIASGGGRANTASHSGGGSGDGVAQQYWWDNTKP